MTWTMGPVTTLTILFIIAAFLHKKISEWIIFFFKSNIKYQILDFMADLIHYGNDIGIDASLSLDSPSKETFALRKEGQSYLASKLAPTNSNLTSRGTDLSTKLVDCRFALAKYLMPLFRELEFPQNGRNFIQSVRHRPQLNTTSGKSLDLSSKGIYQVDTEGASDLFYVGSDAVQTLGMESFYKPIQDEINKRMAFNTIGHESMLRFTPTTLNPELEKNANMILKLTGMDQVRYCLSGSEAMDAALKDIKSSCRNKKVIVRFSSAYHGHVSGVDVLSCGSNHVFLKECSQESIDFIEKYHFRIAAVVVNPMQHFTGINKASPPGEKLTISSRKRDAVPKDVYSRWLHKLQDKCNYCTKYLTKVAFVLDDIYFAFRTPELFSTNYFTHPDTGNVIRPNVLVIGKGIAAGYPLSMVLGQKGYLNTYDKKYLLQVNKTVGTLSAWYGGLVASNIFLEAVTEGSLLKVPVKDQLQEMVAKFDQFTTDLNNQFIQENLPLRIRNFSNTFSINYLSNSVYNCRYTQYLLAEGIFLGNYSTGKFNLTADATKDDLDRLIDKFVSAGIMMKKHGYFVPISSKAKMKMVVSLASRFSANLLKRYYNQIMNDKHIDIEVSHNHPVNKFGHFWSSVFMILVAYPSIFYYGETLRGCLWFFLTHVIRQTGHFFYEHQDRDIEKLKFGHKDGSKKEAVAFLIVMYGLYSYRAFLKDVLQEYIPQDYFNFRLDQYVGLVALFTIIPHYVEITYQFGFFRGVSWMLKIFTDPFTDLLDFYTHAIINPKWFLVFKEHSATYKLDILTKKVTKY